MSDSLEASELPFELILLQIVYADQGNVWLRDTQNDSHLITLVDATVFTEKTFPITSYTL